MKTGNTCAGCDFFSGDDAANGQGFCFAEPPKLMALPVQAGAREQIKAGGNAVTMAVQALRPATMASNIACRYYSAIEPA